MALDAIQDPISLFDPVYQDNGDAIFVMDQVQDKKDTDENWLQEIALKEAIKKVNGRERTQKEVATMLGISQSYISRLEKKIISRLKKEMKKFV